MKKDLAYFCMATAATVIWGSLFVFSKPVLEHMPTVVLLFIRYTVASLLLIGVCKIKKLPAIQKKDYGKMFVVGALGYFASNAAMFLGIHFSMASVSSLINSTNPIFIIILARIFLGERLTAQKFLAVALSVSGAAIIIGISVLGGDLIGTFFSVLSVLLWSYTTIIIKKLTATYGALPVTAWGMAVAAVIALPASIIYLLITKEAVTFTPTVVANVAYICVVCTALAHVCWNTAFDKLGAGRCSIFYPVQPLVAMVLGAIMLHEILGLNSYIGGALIIAGVLVNVLPQKEGNSPKKA